MGDGLERTDVSWTFIFDFLRTQSVERMVRFFGYSLWATRSLNIKNVLIYTHFGFEIFLPHPWTKNFSIVQF